MLLIFFVESPRPLVAGELHAFDYATPAYLDLELETVETYENTKLAVVNVIRTGDFRQTTIVHFRTEEITALNEADFQPTNGTVVFKPGEGYRTIAVSLVTDAETEPAETFRLRFATDPNAVLIRETVNIVIHDAAPASESPKLTIAFREVTKVALSWKYTAHWVLERSRTADGGPWDVVPDEAILKEGWCELIQNCLDGMYFYRLRGP